MKNRIIIAITITLALFSQYVSAVDITDTYATGDALTATKMDSIKTAVNSKLDDAANSVTAGHIAADAVGAAELATNAVTSVDTQDEPGLDFIQEASVGALFDVTNTWTAIKTLTVSAPASGFVNCIATGHINVADLTAITQVNVGWDIDNTTAGVTPDSFNRYRQNGTAGVIYVPITSMHTYAVTAGVHTFSLKIHTSSADATDFDIYVPSTVCMFFATRY